MHSDILTAYSKIIRSRRPNPDFGRVKNSYGVSEEGQVSTIKTVAGSVYIPPLSYLIEIMSFYLYNLGRVRIEKRCGSEYDKG